MATPATPTTPADPKQAEKKPPFTGEKPQRDGGSEAEMRHKPDFGEDSYEGFGRLAGRVALITGADSGIGRAVALAFSREGADVGIAYHHHDGDAAETMRLCADAGHKVATLKADLADEEACRRLVEEAVSYFGRIDLLVNNAAYQGEAVERFEDIDGARVLHTFRVNIVSMFHLTRYALPHMREGGAIINVASVQAYHPSPAILDYAATKGAIVTFTKGLAQDLIERGIRVNCVAPGPVWTPLIAASFDNDKIEAFGAQYPIGRPAQPRELAPAFVFLASDESRYVNGEILGVTGGKPLG